jgi:serine/threonine protein kinase
MKRVRGETLGEHLRHVPDLTERLRIFERVCEPVAFAHARGFIHRDLKPDNVMVGAFGEVMVMDWGVAKTVFSRQSAVESHSLQSQSSVPVSSHGLQSASQSQSQSESESGSAGSALMSVETGVGTVIGTAGFMAPEQARGDAADVDERADVYGLGAILFLLLTDRIPDADPRSRLRLMKVPRPLAAICVRALDVEPSKRYQTVTALAEDVARYRDNRKVHAHRENALERVVRFGRTYRTAILLVLAYIVMRAAVALLAGW